MKEKRLYSQAFRVTSDVFGNNLLKFQLRFDPAITVIETQLNAPLVTCRQNSDCFGLLPSAAMTVILRPEKHSNEIHAFYDRQREVSFIAQT